MQSYIFLDLDDTLFQTRRKCPLDTDPKDLLPRASLPDGSANSFASPKQEWFWQWLKQGFKIVPVTGRDWPALQRVHLPFQEEAVLNHGAVILNSDGTIDQAWQAKIMATLPQYLNELYRLWPLIEAYANQHSGYQLRLVEDFNTIWYGVIKHRSKAEMPLKVLLDEVIKPFASVLNGQLHWHLNGNNLAVLPKIINKQDAVSYLLNHYQSQYPELISFAAGDSYSDAAFMSLCDYAIIPSRTQLFSALPKLTTGL